MAAQKYEITHDNNESGQWYEVEGLKFRFGYNQIRRKDNPTDEETAKAFAERVANLPVLEEEHAKMKATLEAIANGHPDGNPIIHIDNAKKTLEDIK